MPGESWIVAKGTPSENPELEWNGLAGSLHVDVTVLQSLTEHGHPLRLMQRHCREGLWKLLEIEKAAKKAIRRGRRRVETGGVPSESQGTTKKQHHVCMRRRVSEAAGGPLRILTNPERKSGKGSSWRSGAGRVEYWSFSAAC